LGPGFLLTDGFFQWGMWSGLWQEGIKSLIAHLVEKFSTKLEGVDYVDTFQALKLKYEQVSDGTKP